MAFLTMEDQLRSAVKWTTCLFVAMMSVSILSTSYTLAGDSMLSDFIRPSVGVPVVSIDDFVVGRVWTWDYVEPSGRLYSSERYTVLSKQGTEVLIEMSSVYGTDAQQPGGPANSSYHPTHRLKVDVQKCLRAYHNPYHREAWSFHMFYLSDPQTGTWSEFDQTKTLAFEEKFNCNPYVFSGPYDNYATVFARQSGEDVFEQKLWRHLESSWFSMTGVNSGVAFTKIFDADPNLTYTMRRREHRNFRRSSRVRD